MSSESSERDQLFDQEPADLQPFIPAVNIQGQIRQYIPRRWLDESSEDSAISSNNQVR